MSARGVTITGAAVGAFLLGVLYQLLVTWVAMLALGAAHSHDDRVPAFGFLTCFWLGLAIRMFSDHLDKKD